MPLVEIQDLKVSFSQYGGEIHAVRGISFSVNEGESLGIVGESGSGKSVSCSALLRLLPATAKVSAKSITLDGVDVLKANKEDLARLRGRSAAMIFQDPMTAFDPVFTIGHQIAETIQSHRKVSKREALAEAEQLLLRVEIKNAKDILTYYPHQLSGGMLQRAMIAMALSCRPKVLIADEPTTALDVTIQAQILQLIKKVQAEFGMALIMITHDLGVIAETVDRVLVMYNGEVMEQGPVQQIFDAPQHAYTRTLLASLQTTFEPSRGDGSAAPALELRGLAKAYRIKRRSGFFTSYGDFHAVRPVDITLPRNSIVGLVGESGSGKTTTGMMAMRLTEPSSGQILVDGVDITSLTPDQLKSHRRSMQIVFQDSYSALDPMMTLTQIIAEPLHIHGIGTTREQTEKALGWLERVGLPRSFGNRYAHELSGGQRQRVAIARALILGPKVLVADEPTSALDVTVKAQIIGLLKELQAEMGLSILFISHDLSTVKSLTDSVVVMYRGRVVEQAPTSAIFADPQHPYTRALLDAIPASNPRDKRERTFLAAADLEAQTPRYTVIQTGLAPNATPQLVTIAPNHRVEAIVTT
ncbi:peptide/nickel transport system ATP-binding protein/glutathione transport system ATP-binding protein [Devosia sp. YR412]|uniref:ABC transporter ATP-binding protein n=1 Tax=Devosia sp. YR412 TaxID=1881030 RepID=UPI0008D2E4E0|nr:ABC transporter ATP-binding protein [Devosia sp. YR412]SEQ03035.1 peptide/nickel transport system ATP-binding protein/glutathione transport system ATP-binding protein [Devosia sp. YR412]